MILTICKNIL